MVTVVSASTLKLLGVGALCLLFGVPLAMVGQLVEERAARMGEAEAGIALSQGKAQVLSPPVLEWQQRRLQQKKQGTIEVVDVQGLAPLTTKIDGKLGVEPRQRGIFRIPVYQVEVVVHGTFVMAAEDRVRASMPAGAERLRFVLPVVDLRGVRSVPQLTIDGHRLALRSMGRSVFGVDALGVDLPLELLTRERLVFELELSLRGTRELSIWPLAETTEVALAGTWPTPSFAGAFLPNERELGAAGFAARWLVLAVNRDLPNRWSKMAPGADALEAARFFVELYEPLGVYRLNERSLKYGLLFFALTFVVFLLTEWICRLRIHPVQYLLVGLALAAFYVVLLALSEHLGFAPAYGLAAALLTAILSVWGSAALGSRWRGAALGGWFAVLYGVLFLMVGSEDYALLIGAFGLLTMVAASLLLTRHMDWYQPVGEPTRAA